MQLLSLVMTLEEQERLSRDRQQVTEGPISAETHASLMLRRSHSIYQCSSCINLISWSWILRSGPWTLNLSCDSRCKIFVPLAHGEFSRTDVIFIDNDVIFKVMNCCSFMPGFDQPNTTQGPGMLAPSMNKSGAILVMSTSPWYQSHHWILGRRHLG